MKSNFGPPTNQVKLIFSESSELELSEYTIFIDFRQVCKKLWEYKKNLSLFGMGSFQIWSYHVIQRKNLSFLYSKSYSVLTLLRTAFYDFLSYGGDFYPTPQKTTLKLFDWFEMWYT